MARASASSSRRELSSRSELWGWAALFLILGVPLITGCGTDGKTYEGQQIYIDYSNADIAPGDWIQIDAFRFDHIGDRSQASEVAYPLPSRSVFVDSVEGRRFERDYNPRGMPIYIAAHLRRINEGRSENEQYTILNRALMAYSGVLALGRRDSSTIRVTLSEGYGAEVSMGQRGN